MKKIYQSALLLLISLVLLSLETNALTVTVVTSSPGCLSGQDGSAIVTVSGGTAPYSYSLNGVSWQSCNLFTGLTSGSYTVSVTDASPGGSGSANFIITDGPSLSGVTTVTPTLCYNGPGAIVTVTATSGVGPYTFMFNGGNAITGTAATFTHDIYAGTYDVVFIDINGCTGSIPVTIPNGDSLRGTAIVKPPSCSTAVDGLAQFHFDNGVPPYTMVDPNWGTLSGMHSDDGSNSSTGNFAAGTYSWWLQDSIGCEGLLTMVVPVGAPASTHAGADTAICFGSSVQLSGIDNGTMFGTDFEWSPPNGLSYTSISNPLATPTATTSYILTTQMNMSITGIYCVSSDTITITVIDITTPLIESNASTLTVTNVQMGVTYTWQQLIGTTWTDVATGSSYLVRSTSDYRVSASNGACEQYSTPITVRVSSPGNRFAIAMYPNPATDVLLLDELKLSDQWQSLEIINSQGQKAMPAKDIRNQTSVSVNVASLNSGIYVAKLTNAVGLAAEIRFIKQ